MLYTFTRQNQLPQFPAIEGLEIRENSDPVFMSIINQISLEEATSRLANDNKAYVAYLNNVPAAFGWMAMGKARIGELNHEFILPLRHRYLWNFRTLAEFRGLGIYPHLLVAIMAAELPHSDCFWIMHAPENKASERGIRKAGFSFIGKVSVVNGNEVIIGEEHTATMLHEVLDMLGFTKSDKEQPSCWNCSNPYLTKRKTECCCSANKQECTQNLYTVA